jgi:hypothetical protein
MAISFIPKLTMADMDKVGCTDDTPCKPAALRYGKGKGDFEWISEGDGGGV